MDVYLVTCASLPEGDSDAILLARSLRTAGISTRIVAWDAPGVPWATARATIIRSTWDYHTRRPEFLRWAASVPNLHNPAELLVWNTNKRYLLELAERVPVVPSQILADPDIQVLEAALASAGWTDAVLKPAVGLDGHGVARIRAGQVEPGSWMGDWVLQPFVEDSASRGETSLMFIEGRFTHAVQRVPAPSDFRSQERFGGRVFPCHPDADIQRVAHAAIGWMQPSPLYARVDIVRYEGAPCIMELELVEPSLYLGTNPHGLSLMTQAVKRLATASAYP